MENILLLKNLIIEKESEVQQVNLINVDLQTKIDNLQGNLVRLNEYFNTVREFDHNKSKEKTKKKKSRIIIKRNFLLRKKLL